MLELKEFQIQSIEWLLEAINSDKRKIIFKSCTGSGKTIILTNFIKELYKFKSKAVFIWLTPGKGDLEEQSKIKMDKYVHNSHTCYLDKVLSQGFFSQDVCFINWERLTKSGNIALKEGERENFYERIEEARRNGLQFYAIIDESHQNDTGKSDNLLHHLSPEVIIRSSATPLQKKDYFEIEVPESDVIAQGLIKKKILVNFNFEQIIKIEDEVDFLLNKAFAMQKKLRNSFQKLNEDVNPLILVQLENNNEILLRAVETWFENHNITYKNGKLAIWLSGNIENKENIEYNDSKQIALIFKQAIATGWDCPRAQILVKLRDNMSETFSIQTIGRIRRMPRAHHYPDEILNNCYIYTFDEKFVEDAKHCARGSVLDSCYIYIKNKYKKISLATEQRDSLSPKVDERVALKAIRTYLINKYSLKEKDHEGNLNKLDSKGYVFADDISKYTKSGSVENLIIDGFDSLNRIEVHSISSPKDLHDLHNRILYHIAIKVGFGAGKGYSLLLKIVQRLFDRRKAKLKYNIVKLDLYDVYRFVINNKDLLVEDISEALADVSFNQVLDMKLSRTIGYHFPEQLLFTYDKTNRNQNVSNKNIYEYYLMSAEPRTSPERRFEYFCESNSAIEWFYKNGDKGNEYLSIVYFDNSGKQKLFYPDYVLKLKNSKDYFIVETKGGWSHTGKSEDIDMYSPKKHNTLREFCKKHGYKGGFVREDKQSLELLICDFQNDYTDDVNSKQWVELNSYLDEEAK